MRFSKRGLTSFFGSAFDFNGAAAIFFEPFFKVPDDFFATPPLAEVLLVVLFLPEPALADMMMVEENGTDQSENAKENEFSTDSFFFDNRVEKECRIIANIFSEFDSSG